MLIAISGSQGSGKSTIINKIRELGYNTIERKTSRSILTEWDVTLEEVNNNPDLTIKFQEEISKRKFIDERDAIASPQLWFTERTHADLFTYALVSLGKDNTYSDWLNEYYHQCMKYNLHYTAVFYLRAGHFNIEHDGTRGSNVHYSRMVDLTMLDVTQQMVHNSKLAVIETPDLTQRVNIITLQSIGGLSAPMQFTTYLNN
jgi:predicted ATPase